MAGGKGAAHRFGQLDRGVSPAADVLKFTKTLTWNADGSPATVNEGSDTLSRL